MNILKKVYCRSFQTVFHLALPFLPYREPKIYNSINELPKQLEALRISSVMLITDAGIKNAGITQPLENLLKESRLKFLSKRICQAFMRKS